MDSLFNVRCTKSQRVHPTLVSSLVVSLAHRHPNRAYAPMRLDSECSFAGCVTEASNCDLDHGRAANGLSAAHKRRLEASELERFALTCRPRMRSSFWPTDALQTRTTYGCRCAALVGCRRERLQGRLQRRRVRLQHQRGVPVRVPLRSVGEALHAGAAQPTRDRQSRCRLDPLRHGRSQRVAQGRSRRRS